MTILTCQLIRFLNFRYGTKFKKNILIDFIQRSVHGLTFRGKIK